MLKFTKTDHDRITTTLHEMQAITSAPIHIHFCHHCSKSVMRSAIKFFKHSGLNRTAERNAVLIFIARASERFAILGDAGTHTKLPESFWDDCQEQLTEKFKQALFVEGIEESIKKIAHALSEYFPAEK